MTRVKRKFFECVFAIRGRGKKEKSEEEGCGVQDASKMRANFFLARRREMEIAS